MILAIAKCLVQAKFCFWKVITILFQEFNYCNPSLLTDSNADKCFFTQIHHLIVNLLIQWSRNENEIGGSNILLFDPMRDAMMLCILYRENLVMMIHILYILCKLLGGPGPPYLDIWGGQWPPQPPLFLLHCDQFTD